MRTDYVFILSICETQVFNEDVRVLNIFSSFLRKTKEFGVMVNLNRVCESSPSPEHSLHLAWLKFL